MSEPSVKPIRSRKFPAECRTPEFDPTVWNPDGIRIGGNAGMLNVNFCINATCGNFGLSDTRDPMRNRRYRIRMKGNTLHLVCKQCGLTRKIYSNEAVEKMFLNVLGKNVLHAYCSNKACDNYRVNVYENMHAGRKPKNQPRGYSRGNGPIPNDPNKFKEYQYRVRCGRCGTRVTVGPAWRLHGEDPKRRDKSIEVKNPDYEYVYPSKIQQFVKSVCNGMGPSKLMEEIDCHPEHYYAHLHALADACTFISNRHMMGLQSSEYIQGEHYEKNNRCMRLYSDMMEISIFLGGQKKRAVMLPCLVTTTDYNESYFALAFTPMFIPGTLPKDDLKKMREVEAHSYECHRAHAHLQWGGTPVNSEKTGSELNTSFPVLGLGGTYVTSSYGAMAHFLVLRKMLSRIDRVVHYVDNENVLLAAALTAFSDKIRAGSCEVVSVTINQHLKKKEAEEKTSKDRDAFLEKYAGFKRRKSGRTDESMPSGERLRALRKEALLETVAGFEDAIVKATKAYKKHRRTIAKNRRFADARAYACRNALNIISPKKKTTDDKTKLSLWAKDPLPPAFEVGRHFMWLTRRQSESIEALMEQEVELYLDGKHQPADTYMSSMRQNASAAERARLIASTRSGAGYLSNARKPKHAISEFELYRFGWNFMRRRRTRKNRHITRAIEFGLPVLGALTVEDAKEIRKQVYTWAEEITEWLGT